MEKLNDFSLNNNAHVTTAKHIDIVANSLSQALNGLKGIISDTQGLEHEMNKYKSKYLLLKEDNERKTCNTCKELQKTVNNKNNVILLVASALKKLEQSKNFEFLIEAIKVLCDEDITQECSSNKSKDGSPSADKTEIFKQPTTDKNDTETPTGRTSPIIVPSKRINHRRMSDKNTTSENSIRESQDVNMIELSHTPKRSKISDSRNMKQTKLNLRKRTSKSVVDLAKYNSMDIARKEVTDDDMIFPSPTSAPLQAEYSSIYKALKKQSPEKVAGENMNANKARDVVTLKIEILPDESSLSQLPIVCSPTAFNEIDNDMTHCEIEPSMSLLENALRNGSPSKSPLAVNVNASNIPNCNESISLLPQNNTHLDNEKTKRKDIENINQPVYKEPTVRKKAEKRALKGWSCEQCKNFYDELYKDKPEILARLMDECSRHRGKCNPARPKTPPGFWYPRWEVETDTEAFNRQNNAL